LKRHKLWEKNSPFLGRKYFIHWKAWEFELRWIFQWVFVEEQTCPRSRSSANSFLLFSFMDIGYTSRFPFQYLTLSLSPIRSLRWSVQSHVDVVIVVRIETQFRLPSTLLRWIQSHRRTLWNSRIQRPEKKANESKRNNILTVLREKSENEKEWVPLSNYSALYRGVDQKSLGLFFLFPPQIIAVLRIYWLLVIFNDDKETIWSSWKRCRKIHFPQLRFWLTLP
jgi:hypothetical protein